MRNPRVANRYAKTLFDLAIEMKQVETVKNDVDQLRSIQNRELNRILFSPVITSAKKVSIFNAIVGEHISALSKSFFNLVFQKGRDILMKEIIDSFYELYREYKGIEILKITTAQPISDEVKQDIVNRFQNRPMFVGKQIVLETVVNPQIIGGFVAESSSLLFDASIRHDLEVIRKQFVENMYVSKLGVS